MIKNSFSFLLSSFFFLLITSRSFSQQEFSFASLSNDTSRVFTGIYGDAFLNSAALNNDFFHQFRKNGFVSEKIKDEISAKLSDRNRAGADLNYGLFFSHPLKNNFSLFINIADRAHLDARFPKDLFDLAMYGNKKFAGDTAVLDHTNISFLRFQQFQTGIIKTSGNGSRYGFALSYLKGEEDFSLKMPRARLYTQQYGESLDADFSAKINRSDTAKKGIKAVNGQGISTDIFIEIPMRMTKYKGFVRVDASDLGFIQWNEKSLRYKGDTTLHFEGINVKNIFQLNDSLLKKISPDSIAGNPQAMQQKRKYTTRLPAMFRIMWQIEAGKYLFSFGINNRIYANYSPFIYFKTGYKITKNFSAATKIAYGGYGKNAVGAELNLSLKKFSLLVGSNNLEGLALPNYSGGNSGYVAIRKGF